MNKNNIIGAVLMAAVFIGYSIYSQPSAEEKAAAARQDSIENVARKNAENAAKLAQPHFSIPLSKAKPQTWC